MSEETQHTQSSEASNSADNIRSAFDSFLEHQRRAFEETGKAVDALLPEGFKEHSAIARDEFRKGLKVLVDASIDELEKMTKVEVKPSDDTDSSDDEDKPSTTGKTKVKVQVD